MYIFEKDLYAFVYIFWQLFVYNLELGMGHMPKKVRLTITHHRVDRRFCEAILQNNGGARLDPHQFAFGPFAEVKL